MEFEYLGLAGHALSITEKTAIRCSLTLLAQSSKQKVRFWGKVLGYHGDYFVAQSIPDIIDGDVSSYYSVDGGTNWVHLIYVTPEQIEFCDKIRGTFIGQPGFVYKIRKDVPPEEEPEPVLPSTEEQEGEEEEAVEDEKDEDAEEAEAEAEPEAEGEDAGEEVKPVKKRPKFQIIAMAESIRLSYFVSEHDKACKLVVRGAFLQNNGKVSKNHTFAGLDVPSACKLSSYVKVFSSADVAVNREIYGPSYTAAWDFMSPVTVDRPEDVWILKYDESLGIVTVQNLLFEGSIFYHTPGTAAFGQVYIGTGERNLDLCFILP